MSDRELLELAAKASGLHIVTDPDGLLRDCTKAHPAMNIFACKFWNPLTDDGDALRLAAKLYLWQAIRLSHRLVSEHIDIYAATRRSIVLSAAEIGKTK